MSEGSHLEKRRRKRGGGKGETLDLNECTPW